ncbi:hypothetical protein IB286_03780 [Spongiibacter sp. KMU-158]|uniref:RING-type E3 ubiquitin transferase n=1 Tax=Spongiibacter pelagi TaxID=2760804 RepID=A0A927C1V5_9GAMM|nr:GIDE domain-containing protein [Spongiibacter pelagi]MBD2858116.1 hypothetical protein [Spongiibacter pelagi]
MSGEYYAFLGFAIVACLVAAFFGFVQLKKARIIEDTPTSKIRSAHQGYVELMGISKNLVAESPLLSPLSGTNCIWFSYKIERYETSGKNKHWRTLESRSSERPFLLDDSTEPCYIMPSRADVSTFRKSTWYGNERYPSAGKTSSSLFGRRYRYTEHLLCEDDLLYAIGLFQTRHPPSSLAQSRQRMAEILSEWKQDYDRLVARFDRNGDGEIDLVEWDLARQEAQRAAEREQRKTAAETKPIHTLSYSPSRHQPFILATSEPESLSRRFRWQALGLFLVSSAALAGATWIFLHPQNFQ